MHQVAVEEAPQCSEGERSDAERSGGASSTAARPDPEVLEKPQRRTFTAAYKLRVLREAESSPGQIGALLRREGLYSSHLTTWRRQREAGELAGLTPRKRGQKGKPRDPHADQVKQLERENRKLSRQLRRAEMIIDVQKKIAEILGIQLDPVDLDEND